MKDQYVYVNGYVLPSNYESYPGTTLLIDEWKILLERKIRIIKLKVSKSNSFYNYIDNKWVREMYNINISSWIIGQEGLNIVSNDTVKAFRYVDHVKGNII